MIVNPMKAQYQYGAQYAVRPKSEEAVASFASMVVTPLHLGTLTSGQCSNS